jgi:hypothetical protein
MKGSEKFSDMTEPDGQEAFLHFFNALQPSRY